MDPQTVFKKDFVVAPCRAACPAGVDGARYIRAVLAGKYDDAVAVVRERIPFPVVCGDACFAPCEDACAYRQFGDPIAIRALKRAAVDFASKSWKPKKIKEIASGKKVAVIGAGPAGLTAAYYLALLGHAVKVFDAFPEPGGTMRYGLPEFRLPKDRLAKDIQYILDAGVQFQGNTSIGKDISFRQIKQDYDAVFVGVGVSQSIDAPIEGSGKAGVYAGWELLKDLALGKKFDLRGEVLVIGGGNVAVDVARTARRLGADNVTIVYRRTRDEMPANLAEIQAAEEEGVLVVDSWAPKKISGTDKVAGLGLVRCFTDASCNYEPVYDEEITHKLKADHIILALGQKADLGFLSGESDISIGKLGLEVDQEALRTGQKNVFAGGDVVTGPSSIISAIAQGRQAAEAIDKYLGGTGNIQQTLAKPEESVILPELTEDPEPRHPIPMLKAWARSSRFDQAELGYDQSLAAAEASRCLRCDARRFEVVVNTENCKECGYCAEVCRLNMFSPADFFNKRGYRPMVCKSSDACAGCLKCYYACPDFAIDVRVKSAAE